MGPVPLLAFRQGCRCREPPGVAAHHLDDRNGRRPAHCLGVSAGAHDGQGNEAAGAAVAGRVVCQHQVVVDGLGHVYDGQLPTGGAGLRSHPVGGLGRVVAAYGEPVSYVVFPEDTENRRHVLVADFAA